MCPVPGYVEEHRVGDGAVSGDMMIRATLLRSCSAPEFAAPLLEGLAEWQIDRIALLVRALNGEENGQVFRRAAGFDKGGRPRLAKS